MGFIARQCVRLMPTAISFALLPFLSFSAAHAMSIGTPFPSDVHCINFGPSPRDFGAVIDEDWNSWLPGFRFAKGEEHLAVEVVNAETSHLRHNFIPTAEGSDRVVVASDIEHHRTYRISQSVFLEPGWEWGGDTYQGGKLGFGFGGGTAPSGGIIDPAGFTARIMWRGHYLGGGEYDGTGRLVIYSYAADRPDALGEDYRIGEFSVPIGEWFNIVFEVEANSSITESDGSARAWINGELLLDENDIAWQLAGDRPIIDTLYYSSFYGGASRGWAPSKPTYLKIKDVCWAAVIDGVSGIEPDEIQRQINSPK